MKRIVMQVSLLFAVACGSGCTTAYWVDRGRDAADVFTFTLGVGAGANARIGPAVLGTVASADIIGVRGGTTFLSTDFDDAWETQIPFWTTEGWFRGFSGAIVFQVDDPIMRQRRKDLEICILYFVWADPVSEPAPNYTEIEVVVGLGPSVRLGFNPGELLDFFLGWFGVDIYDDDVEDRRKLGINSGPRVDGDSADEDI